MILITGGTGQSGSEIVRQLSASGAMFRMMVRDPIKAAAAAPAEAELVKGDFADVQSIEAAAEGCDVALFNSDGNPKLAEQQRNFLAGIQKAGVKRVVRFSVMGADPKSPMDFPRWHGEAEVDLKNSGLPWTLLQPTFFMQNLLGSAGSIKSQGSIYAPANDGKAPYVDLADIAAVAVKALTTAGHERKSYVITGPRDVSYHDIAKAIGDAIGRQIKYVNIPPEAAKQSLLSAGLPEWRADAVLGLMTGTRNGWMAGVSDDVRKVTGRPAKSFEQWAKENAAAFR
jgi:uncharacterized protein YbjT (DUF2867 family)